MTEDCDVCVIGAGPAGMAAARVLHAHGLHTIVLEERPDPGGNIFSGALRGPLARGSGIGEDYRKGASMTQAFARAQIDIRCASSVIRIDGNMITFGQGEAVTRLRARRIVLATGAMERPMPFAGWTRPGVMGAGAMQLLLKQSGLVPSGRYLLCGNGPLVLLLADQLMRLGAPPLAVLDTNPVRSPTRVALSHLPALFGCWSQVRKGLGYMARLRHSGVPVIRNVTRIEAHGDGERLASVSYVTGTGVAGNLATDMLLCHEGVIPNSQLAMALGCQHRWNAAQSCTEAITDEWGRTSRSHVFAVGDCAGVLGASAAPLTAELAALKIAADLGRTGADAVRPAVTRLQSALARERRFRGFLDAAYRPGIARVTPIADETIICRCEQVTAESVRQAVRDGAIGPAQTKVFSRCGMGLCQGRTCGSLVNRIISEETGIDNGTVGAFHIRFPLKPMSLSELATVPDAEPKETDRVEADNAA